MRVCSIPNIKWIYVCMYICVDLVCIIRVSTEDSLRESLISHCTNLNAYVPMAQSFLFLLFFSVILTSSFFLFVYFLLIGWPASHVVLCSSSLFILVIITTLSSFSASAPLFFTFPIFLFFPDLDMAILIRTNASLTLFIYMSLILH